MSAVSRISAVHISQERSRRNWKIEKLSPMLFLGELTEVMFAQLFAGVELDDGLSQIQICFSVCGAGVNHWYRVIIKEYRKRAMWRLFDPFGFTVSPAHPHPLRPDSPAAEVAPWAENRTRRGSGCTGAGIGGNGAEFASANARRAGEANPKASDSLRRGGLISCLTTVG